MGAVGLGNICRQQDVARRQGGPGEGRRLLRLLCLRVPVSETQRRPLITNSRMVYASLQASASLGSWGPPMKTGSSQHHVALLPRRARTVLKGIHLVAFPLVLVCARARLRVQGRAAQATATRSRRRGPFCARQFGGGTRCSFEALCRTVCVAGAGPFSVLSVTAEPRMPRFAGKPDSFGTLGMPPSTPAGATGHFR